MAHDSNSFLDADQNPHIIQLTQSKYNSLESYQELGLSKELLQALLDDLRLRNPSRLHAILLPLIASQPHRSLCAQARPSVDKHRGYVLGILHRIDFHSHGNPQAVVVCPTLPLAQQILDTVATVGCYTGVTSQLFDGEVLPETPVLKSHIVITLPSTIYRLLTLKKLLLDELKVFVIDAADHPSQLSSKDMWDSAYVMGAVPTDCQILLFYSTLTDKLRDNIPTILPDWKWNRLFVNQEELSIYQSKLFQFICYGEEWKAQGVKRVLLSVKEMQAVIYVKPGADLLILRNELACIRSLVIAPELGGEADAIIKFKRAEARVLITCKPMYFGFDLSKVNLVFFFHLPVESEGVIDFETYYRVATWGGRHLNKACVFHMISSGDEEMVNVDKIGEHFGRVVNKLFGEDDTPLAEAHQYYDALDKGFLDYERLPDEENDDLHVS